MPETPPEDPDLFAAAAVDAIASADMDVDLRVQSLIDEAASIDLPNHETFVLERAYKFEDTNKRAWDELCNIVQMYKPCKEFQDVLRIRLGEIMSEHQFTWTEESKQSLRTAFNKAEVAAQNLLEFIQLVSKVPYRHDKLRRTYETLAELARFPVRRINMNTLLLRFRLQAETLLLTATALCLTTGTTNTVRRGRPSSNWLLPVLSLVELWEEISGQKMPSAKGYAEGNSPEGRVPEQPGVQFVFHAMELFDPRFKTANAITEVRKVLEFRKGVEGGISQCSESDSSELLMRLRALVGSSEA